MKISEEWLLVWKNSQKPAPWLFLGHNHIRKYKTLVSFKRKNKNYKITKKLKKDLSYHACALCNMVWRSWPLLKKWRTLYQMKRFPFTCDVRCRLGEKKYFFYKLNRNKLLLLFVAPKCAPIPKWITVSFSFRGFFLVNLIYIWRLHMWLSMYSPWTQIP